jgi:hypothetical protein
VLTPSAAGQGTAIERYLAEVAGRLPGPRRAHTAIVTELRSGLCDTADAYRGAGLSQAQAADQAVAEFGDPAEVAAAFWPEIAASQARRMVLIVLVTGPLVGLLWVAAGLTSQLGVRFALPWHWTGEPPALLAVSAARLRGGGGERRPHRVRSPRRSALPGLACRPCLLTWSVL